VVRVFIEHPAADAAPDHELLRRAVARVAGCPASEVVIDRTCSRCGEQHGKPQVVGTASRHGDETGELQVSVARCPGVVAVAVTRGAPIGIDIEAIDRVLRAPIDLAAFHAAELAEFDHLAPAEAARAKTEQWTRKESLLKATGDGLRVDPSRIRLSVGHARAVTDEVIDWPAEIPGPGPVSFTALDLESGLVGSVAALTSRPLTVEFAAV
jgi:4'-phosphopantetheinyl transferase